ncbi:methylisocitrate lyase [Edaphobacillus lindanitolerans]|uniref:Methylisocitrate lyase n=1 Tax=Edaphobacillus lindanitolerans TaxID=550447 RepID=A0A1U7PN68_9BACI|nr:methylisocitrate lyase [Edaphobacillus lindanitolerans]SIT72473.1 methylisocitrate lyase [Edaphobacillus lindanitolerans]
MSWFVQEQSRQEKLAERFMEEVRKKEILKIPGAHDGMSALIAKQAGFQALYLSGAAYSASRGLPDLGMIYSNEVAERAGELVRATDLPVLVDIDTGYGGILNCVRTALEMKEHRVAAVQIEDQVMPKKCGHLNGKVLVSVVEMIQKIRAIKEAVPSLIVVARTDAVAVEGMEGAIERANAYVGAGADVIFSEALTCKDEFKAFKERVRAPLLANMTEFGQTPYYTSEKFEQFGYSIVIYPVTSLRVAAKAYERVFNEIYKQGTQKGSLADMQTRKSLYETIRYFEYEELDGEIAKTKGWMEGNSDPEHGGSLS